MRPATLTYILDLDSVKMRRHCTYLGHRLSSSKVVVRTHGPTGLITEPGPLNWLITTRRLTTRASRWQDWLWQNTVFLSVAYNNAYYQPPAEQRSSRLHLIFTDRGVLYLSHRPKLPR